MSAMAVDQRPQPAFGGGMGYDNMRYASQQPHFTNPWAATGSAPATSLYHTPMHQHPQQHQSIPHSAAASRNGSITMPYAANPAASTMASNLVPSRSYDTQYTSAPKLDSASSYQHSDSSRSFSDIVDASRGMVAMSQSNYGSSRTSSQDSYGFPSSHSSHSSISSAGTYPYYGNSYGSVDNSSMTDYSSASDDAMAQRTLPAPNQLISGFPPDQNTMMNQFNSKLAPNTQKKHKCKICDKRFTRPSSLQTHMYSHTGEKPFACDYDGCGRHFSVVSNLRRHKKVHKENGGMDSASPEADD